MNCAIWEERIALYMGGDLAPAESAPVERHLAECAGCQVFASGMREGLAVLRGAHADELDAAAFTAVRARVLGELQRQPARRWLFGLGAVAALLLLAIWMRPVKHVAVAHRELPAPVREAVRAPAVRKTPEVARAAPVRRHRTARTATLVRPAALPEKPLVVKLVTDDPSIVIYWITDTRGE